MLLVCFLLRYAVVVMFWGFGYVSIMSAVKIIHWPSTNIFVKMCLFEFLVKYQMVQ